MNLRDKDCQNFLTVPNLKHLLSNSQRILNEKYSFDISRTNIDNKKLVYGFMQDVQDQMRDNDKTNDKMKKWGLAIKMNML